ncbi:MAG: hypothetical protein H0Z30_10315 [Candidatus Marinimicrobia bacterium]|nr:hypothetical protein [Candidatus Neomarinimicrobiota bacterium]
MPYPWKFLVVSDGVVLVEVLEYARLPIKNAFKKGSWDGTLHIRDDIFAERHGIKKYVIRGKVVDDIFDTIEEDTIYVYTSIPIPEIYKSSKVKLLLNLMAELIDFYVNFKGRYVRSYAKYYLALVEDGIIKEYPLKLRGITGAKK